MTEKGWIIVAMWLAYGAGLVTLALKNTDHATGFGVLVGLILAVTTVRLFRKD